MSETVELVDKKIREKQGIHLLGVNADKINEIKTDQEMKRIVLDADIINADGASVVLASKLLGKPLPERVAGIDLMQELLVLANKKGYSVYFLGAKEDVVTKMITKLKVKYHQLDISGYRNGYFSKDEWPDITNKLRELSPDIIFIGITSPTKEYLIDYMLDHNVKSVLMGVGGSFDVLSGNIKRAPKFIQKMNLEWAYRVAQEPKRLFKRYFIGNGRFLKEVLKERRRINEKD